MNICKLNCREYVYVLSGGGPANVSRSKDDLKNIDSKRLLKATNVYGRTIENHLKKYFKNVSECTDLMDVDEKIEYMNKRREKLHDIISKFK